MTDRETWARAASAFTAKADAVPPAGWDSPAPCEGWVARDIVLHLVEWVPAFIEAGAGIALDVAVTPSDPARSWRQLAAAIQGILDDPGVSARRFDHPVAGSHPLDDAIMRFVLGDVVIHAWDLARATGQDEALDPEIVHSMLIGMEPLADLLVQSGQYAPRVPVSDDADEQTRLIALSGRDPHAPHR